MDAVWLIEVDNPKLMWFTSDYSRVVFWQGRKGVRITKFLKENDDGHASGSENGRQTMEPLSVGGSESSSATQSRMGGSEQPFYRFSAGPS